MFTVVKKNMPAKLVSMVSSHEDYLLESVVAKYYSFVYPLYSHSDSRPGDMRSSASFLYRDSNML